jgi:FkbM family methyltransferase
MHFREGMKSAIQRTTGYYLTKESPEERAAALRRARRAGRKAGLRAAAAAAQQAPGPKVPRLFSQFGEDITSEHILRGVRDGFYVDVGAHHPVNHSNTARFHLLGWNGVNVEPSAENFAHFEKMRPNAINVNAAVHNTDDTVTLHTFENGLVNTVVGGRVDGLSADHRSTGAEVVPAYSLNTIFEKFVPEGTKVNYFTMDIEGYDKEAFDAFDVERFLPDVICLELFRTDLTVLGEDPLVQRLVACGYVPYSVNIFSFTFVNIAAAERLNNTHRLKGLHKLAQQRLAAAAE